MVWKVKCNTCSKIYKPKSLKDRFRETRSMVLHRIKCNPIDKSFIESWYLFEGFDVSIQQFELLPMRSEK